MFESTVVSKAPVQHIICIWPHKYDSVCMNMEFIALPSSRNSAGRPTIRVQSRALAQRLQIVPVRLVPKQMTLAFWPVETTVQAKTSAALSRERMINRETGFQI